MIVALIGVPAGVLSALRPRTWIDYTARVIALIGQSAPTYWIGLMLILLFAVRLGWVPASGIGDWRNLVLPAATLGFFSTAKIMRLTRAAMLEILGADYMRTARAKGLTAARVALGHGLRNAWLPIVTQLGVELGTLLSGAIITETVFAWPGVGRLAVQAVFERDFPVVEAVVLIAATIVRAAQPGGRLAVRGARSAHPVRLVATAVAGAGAGSRRRRSPATRTPRRCGGSRAIRPR